MSDISKVTYTAADIEKPSEPLDTQTKPLKKIDPKKLLQDASFTARCRTCDQLHNVNIRLWTDGELSFKLVKS